LAQPDQHSRWAPRLLGIAWAENALVGLPDKSFPESVTSAKDGTLFVGGFNLDGVVKVARAASP
jgi:hypothetical protein